jgi:hypothetical protein
MPKSAGVAGKTFGQPKAVDLEHNGLKRGVF